MNRTLIAVLAFVAWSAGMFGAGWAWRGDRAEGVEARQQASASTAVVEQVNQSRATEQSKALKLADIGAKHEEDRAAAPAVADAVVADLRSGALRLRNDLAACHTDLLSQTAAGAVERDAATQRREEFAGRVVRIGRDADDQLRACQAVVAADRAEVIQ
ncbi:lysis system i-spanin subunit Rz [Stenotrophomonas rhizophila]|uniref:lysis system i-spanin subunit Rz n=1 Tax=Stenotrophomonas rhizophila TaxID=216778 RepID=UPI0028AECFC8|nr:lysis system i-spanin subunit Rz [Stenotrophomonas rhizophila]